MDVCKCKAKGKKKQTKMDDEVIELIEGT
jgi:hypothetical protein